MVSRFLSDLSIAEGVLWLIRGFVIDEVPDSITFPYGQDEERVSSSLHTIPVTQSLWIAFAPERYPIKHVIVSHSAMECICFLSLNTHRFPKLYAIALIATGLRPSFCQAMEIRRLFPNSKKYTVFGNDLFGSLADIVIATGIRRIPVAFAVDNCGDINVSFRSQQHQLSEENFSLNHFEKIIKIRLGVRTFKPHLHETFIEHFM